jgi:hypothetical protein
MGFPSELCEECWADEHRSRRTREHARVPLPLVATADTSIGVSRTAIDARAVLNLQQQVLNLLLHVMPNPRSNCGTQTAALESNHDSSSTAAAWAGRRNALHDAETAETAARLRLEADAHAALLLQALQHRNLTVSEVHIMRPPARR